MPDNPVTVNEYWGGDEKTVFFDEETQFFDDTGNEEIALEWSENGKEKRERIKKDTAYIGKKYEEVDVCISDPTISRKHARISISGNQITLQDLGSTNGTYIEGRRIDPGEEIRLLKNQDFVLGKVAVRVV
jgi:pSer/pThr/pTyr-binding forkhead associated (FHA) protein